jgi:hypothetical protein
MFTDSLNLTLTLTIGGKDIKIPGANIKSLRTDVRPYGFIARLSFWISLLTGSDDLFSPFVKQDIIEVKLEIEPHFKPKDGNIEPLTLKGLVTEKALLAETTIENVHLKGNPVLYRHYQVDFADPAWVIWRQHFPCDLAVDQSVKELIDANKTAGIDIKYDWEALNDKFAVNTLSPGTPEHGVSFYDFIIWYVTAHNGVFSFDFKTNQYSLSEKKKQDGKATAMSELEVADHQIVFPATIRYNDRFLNGLAENPKKSDTSRETAKEGVRRDYLLREPIAADFEKAFNLESKKQKSREHELHINHNRFPLLTYRPDVFVKLEGGLWSEKIFLHGKEYRVRDIFIQAQAADENPDADHNLTYSRYDIDMRSHLEPKDEKALSLPPFEAPLYPIYVEGKIVSEQGKDEEETYQIYKQSQTEIEQYKVKIPLFDDKQVVAPYEPLYLPGHFYFPAYKNERVLVALDFHSARIVGFLDWRPGGRLPMDTQGNHILFGKKDDESSTSISHIYVDNKPQLNVKRLSSKDTEIIQLQEGKIILQTKEESS